MDIENNSKFFDTKKITKYPPKNSSPNFESYFFDNYKKNNLQTNLEYLPIQWTNYFIDNNYGEDLSEINKYLEKNLDNKKKYFTITQLAGGPLVSLENTLVFSMGGMFRTPKNINLSHIFLPLLFKDLKMAELKEKTYLACYIGRETHPLRIKIEKKLKNKKGFYVKNLDSMRSEFTNKESDIYNSIIESSYFSICPRGYGPTSFRLYESIALSSIPIYISDEFILPFKEIINWNNLAILIKPNEIKKIPNIIDNILNSNQYEEMLAYGRHCFKNYFDFQFLDEYIRNTIAKF